MYMYMYVEHFITPYRAILEVTVSVTLDNYQ